MTMYLLAIAWLVAQPIEIVQPARAAPPAEVGHPTEVAALPDVALASVVPEAASGPGEVSASAKRTAGDEQRLRGVLAGMHLGFSLEELREGVCAEDADPKGMYAVRTCLRAPSAGVHQTPELSITTRFETRSRQVGVMRFVEVEVEREGVKIFNRTLSGVRVRSNGRGSYSNQQSHDLGVFTPGQFVVTTRTRQLPDREVEQRFALGAETLFGAVPDGCAVRLMPNRDVVMGCARPEDGVVQVLVACRAEGGRCASGEANTMKLAVHGRRAVATGEVGSITGRRARRFSGPWALPLRGYVAWSVVDVRWDAVASTRDDPITFVVDGVALQGMPRSGSSN